MKYFQILILVILLTGCSAVYLKGKTSSNNTSIEQKAEYRKISAGQAKKMLDDNKDIILLDVRTKEEFLEKRIAGSILIPDNEILTKAETTLKDKNAIILVYCRSGRRSEAAARQLVGMGYTNIFDFGGIIDWPYDTISGN